MFLAMFARSYAVTALRSYHKVLATICCDKVVAAIKGVAAGNVVAAGEAVSERKRAFGGMQNLTFPQNFP